jgi:hypothetical protein
MFAPSVRSLLLGIAMTALALPAAAQTGTISGRVYRSRDEPRNRETSAFARFQECAR